MAQLNKRNICSGKGSDSDKRTIQIPAHGGSTVENVQMKLDKKNIEDIISLTSMQEGLLFHYITDQSGQEYHEQVSIDLEGDLNLALWQRAWDFVIQKNEMLRVVFRWKGIDKPVQVILRNHQVLIQFYDYSEQEKSKRSSCLAAIKRIDLDTRFNIEKETLRLAICKFSDNEYTMIISHHHILYDGWSNGIIIKELMSAYNALSRGEEPVTTPKSQFKEHVAWLKSQDKKQQKAYWSHHLHGAEQNDTFFSRGNLWEMKRHKRVLSQNVGDQIKAFAKMNEVSVAAVLYSTWGLLVQNLNYSRDITFGTTTSGRSHALKGINDMVGLFINTVPLRIQTNAHETAIQFIKKVNQLLKERQEFESTPLVDILKYAQVESNSPFFNSLVVIENYPLNPSEINNQTVKINAYSASGRTNYNLTLGITIQDMITLDFNYNCFTDYEMIMRIGQYFENIITMILCDERLKVDEIPLLAKPERDQLLYEFNNTFAEYPKDKTIQQLFEEQVQQTPNNIALMFNEIRMSYLELNHASNQVAQILRDGGVKPEAIVGIIMNRSPLMVIGILGVLKAGGAYLPIDPDYPEERINFMLVDSGSKLVLTESQLRNRIKFDGEKIDLTEITFDQDKVSLFEGNIGGTLEENLANLEIVNHPRDLAYVIYTSGSTGNPKGVMVEHQNVVNLITGQIKKLKITAASRILQISAMSFDAAVGQLFTALFSGASLYLADKHLLSSKLAMLLRDQQITHFIYTVPTHMEGLNLSELPHLKTVTCGGDVCTPKMIKKLNLDPTCQFINNYGPTEATMIASMYTVTPDDDKPSIPIGKPLANIKMYILNLGGNPMPVGVAGELYIGGAGVVRGYMNLPRQTAEKFVANPFIKGERLYRTGDLARWLPDGNIEFLGRIDHQVKIRGFRIELGEIEAAILNDGRIHEAVVMVREEKVNLPEGEALGRKYLCAYFVASEKVDVPSLKKHLASKLPSYMVPAKFIPLAKMPLTPSKKIDRQSLPLPKLTRDDLNTTYVPPKTDDEKLVIGIWRDILATPKIGLEDNFFDLGGNSLDLMQVSARLEKEFNQEVPIVMLFRYPTVSGIVTYLNQDRGEANHTAVLKDSTPFIQNKKDRMKRISQRKKGENDVKNT